MFLYRDVSFLLSLLTAFSFIAPIGKPGVLP